MLKAKSLIKTEKDFWFGGVLFWFSWEVFFCFLLVVSEIGSGDQFLR